MKNKTHQQETTLLTVQVYSPKHKEREEQMKLLKQIQEIEKRIHFEENEQKSIVDRKKEDIVVKTKSIEQLTQTNQLLQTELENLRLQIGTDDKMNDSDKHELQDKNTKFENEKRKRQDPLEQKLKEKELQLHNSLTIIDKYQQDKDALQKQLEEQVDIIQVNAINEEIKLAHSKIETLEKEITYLKHIEKEHSNCIDKEQQVKNEIKMVKEQINLLKLKYKNQRKCNSLSSMFRVYKEEELHKQEEQEKIMKQNLNEFWKEHKEKLSQQQQQSHVKRKSNSPNKKKNVVNINVAKAEVNKRMQSKYEIAKQINNRNILLSSSSTTFKDKNNKMILPPITTKSLFNKNEKEILLNVLPEKEIQKYEKRFEIIDGAKNNLVRKYHLEEKKLNKENKELQSRVEFSEMQLKVNEQKNKILKKQIEDYKNQLGSLDEKLKELNEVLTLQKEQIKEKYNENQMLILKLQELQCESKKEKENDKKEEKSEEEEKEEEEEEEVEVKETEGKNKDNREEKGN